MPKRKIIEIDENKCNGCGLCIPNCPEGAIQIIDGKARLISDLFCDGLGACIGHCPQGAITFTEREAKPYNEKKVMDNVIKQGDNVIKAHLVHLKEHHEEKFLKEALDYLKEKKIESPLNEEPVLTDTYHQGCPGSRLMEFSRKQQSENGLGNAKESDSQLGNWPVQLMLVPAFAPYLNNADVLIAADCVPFAYPSFHDKLLKGKILLVGCPKLDDASVYTEKIVEILKNNDVKSITYAHMEVPCCFGLVDIIKKAIEESKSGSRFEEVVIGIKGERLK
ncbi:MAG: 4Fe-4S binding protein [Candidatus Omnitrophica bacterium]|jgi:ferredoxin|nr:4Fe-4S binding protein [Candidatus Omnitrophota bacterium]MDD4981505.1 4Fe-4S binding protein [Candidatus Omnitrophota bacterium]MDD5665424.1 4Fe-4S binding protein [Candidatus Omnitrophota bacterium]